VTPYFSFLVVNFVLFVAKNQKQSRKHERTKTRNKKIFFFVFLKFRAFVIKFLFWFRYENKWRQAFGAKIG